MGRRRALIGIGAVVCALLAIVAVVAGPRLLLRVPGWIGHLVDPVGPNRPVTWEAGPAVADRPPGARPPNVVVILADDLGWNDLTFAGGGVANGAVPTPRIDSIAREGVSFTAGYTGNATCAPSGDRRA